MNALVILAFVGLVSAVPSIHYVDVDVDEGAVEKVIKSPKKMNLPSSIREIELHLRAGDEEPATVEVTKTVTVDSFVTELAIVSKTVHVTHTEFSFHTVTSTTRQVVRTPANNMVRVATSEVTNPTTITVTNVKAVPVFVTSTSTSVKAMQHTRIRVDFVTVTNTIEQTYSVSATVVSTHVITDYSTTTVRRYTTRYGYAYDNIRPY